MPDTNVYAPPRTVEGLNECRFYHSMDLPKHGLVNGKWDLRLGIDKYLGHVDFHGRRVLDVGTASGFLAFWMESQGAEVIAFDVSENYSWDLVPYGGRIEPQKLDKAADNIRKVNNSFWFARSLLESNVQMVYGSVYEIPEAIGPVDISIFGSILLHVRDPFLALQNALRLTTDMVIVVEPFSILRTVPLALVSVVNPIAAFRPNAQTGDPDIGWWALPPRTIIGFLKVLGFPHTHVSYHFQRYLGKRKLTYTVVGRRAHSGQG